MSRTLITFFLLSVGSASAAPTEWRVDGTVDGMRVELRDVANSEFEEVRVTTSSALPLAALCQAVWGKDAKVEGDFKKRVVIRETDTERWTYEQVHVPLVMDRDCVMFVQQLAPVETGRCEVAFETRQDPGYPEIQDHVRIPLVRGRWNLALTTDGRTSIVYQIYSEPGGGLPALFARGGQRAAAVAFMKTILARAAR